MLSDYSYNKTELKSEYEPIKYSNFYSLDIGKQIRPSEEIQIPHVNMDDIKTGLAYDQFKLSNVNTSSLNQMLLKAYTSRLKISASQQKLQNSIEEVIKLLSDKRIFTEIKPSLFIDMEVSGWEELLLSIPIDKEKYNVELEDKIIEMILSGLDENTSKKIIVSVRPY